jgi:5'-nucleotidase
MIKIMHQKPRILISNDDGIHAAGLKVLEDIASSMTDDIWIVAPEWEQSGAAHSLSIGRPLRFRELGPKRYTVNGTPTDCVMIAVNKLMTECRPDLMLSGVNHGANLGEDVTYSGTVAAAMEATLLGIPAIALSQSLLTDHENAYDPARHYGPLLVKKLISQTWPRHVLININFPDISIDKIQGARVVRQGLRNINDNLVKWKDPHGKPFFWIGGNRDDSPTEEETDLEAIHQGAISITPLHLDLTHHSTLETLKLAFI